LKVAFAPFVPKSSEAIHQALGFSGAVADHGWRRTPVPHGANLQPLPPLFARVEPLEDDLADA
jgi:methionyl-tRNA synthetase